jgi:hypothetical protein
VAKKEKKVAKKEKGEEGGGVSDLRPLGNVPFYRAQSGDDFALARVPKLSFSEKVRGMLGSRRPLPVLVVIYRRSGSKVWYELNGPSLPGLCVDDIHQMSRLWKKFTSAGKPHCYPSG